MDTLSEALNSVRMTGAIFFDAECTAPWGFSIPPMDRVAHILAPGTDRIVGYHLVTEGRAFVKFGDETKIPVQAGDVVIVPHGDPHIVSNGVPNQLIDSGTALGRCLAGELKTLRFGGGGEATRFVCGYFGCERHAARLFLAGLPQVIKINIYSETGGEWLEVSIRHLLSEAASGRPGRTVLLSRMAEALFVESMRRYMEQMPPEQTGWLAGARDPVVGAALALMHRNPCHRWTLSQLASGAGASRSALAERFERFLREPPLTYLARWRMQLAARKLRSSGTTVLQVAIDVGYDSEAAFNRALKREFGLPPARYRKQYPEGIVRLEGDGLSLQ